jgi:hypothetical protein
MASKKTAVSVAAGVIALGAGLGVAGMAAADPTPSPSASPSTSASLSPGTGRPDGQRGPHGERNAELADTLASKLGVTEAKVTEALDAIRDENRPTARPTAGTERPDPAGQDAALAKQLAEKLSVEEAKVTSALDEIRSERRSEHAAALKARLDEAVTDRTLTQAEADAVTKAVEKGVIGGFGRR